MLNLAAFMLGIAVQNPAPANAPVLSECDTSSDIVAKTPLDAAIEVHYAIAGAPSCYQITLTINGQVMRGYVFDPRLDAVAAFEKSRLETEQAAFKAKLYIPPLPAALQPPRTAVAVAKPVPEKKPLPKTPKVSM
jgi:hypothetical protein